MLMVLALVYMLAMALVLPLVIGGTGSGRRVSSYASWRVATPGGRVNANAQAQRHAVHFVGFRFCLLCDRSTCLCNIL